MTRYILTAALLLVGCSDTPSPAPAPRLVVVASGSYWVTVQGTIRFVSYGYQDPHTSLSRVVIETDSGQIFTVGLLDGAPPVWVGLRGVFAYESAGSATQGTWKNFVVKQRLPGALPSEDSK